MEPEFYFQTLYPLQDQVLHLLNGLETGFYLTGGTAASRGYLNHRFSGRFGTATTFSQSRRLGKRTLDLAATGRKVSKRFETVGRGTDFVLISKAKTPKHSPQPLTHLPSNSQFGRKDLTGFHCSCNFGANWDQNLSGLVIFRIAGICHACWTPDRNMIT